MFPKSAVDRLRGTVKIAYTLAERGAQRFRAELERVSKIPDGKISALGVTSGMQAVQLAKAGIGGCYASGWQTAGDANESDQTYPDLSLYPVNSVPKLIRRFNAAFQRADQIFNHGKEKPFDYYLPVIADCEAGFGSVLNMFELVKACIEAGASSVHAEDQLSSAKKCGHLSGKVLISTHDAIQNLKAAKLAAEVMDVPIVIIARTDANSAEFIVSDADPNDRPFIIDGTRTEQGFYRIRNGIETAIARGIAYAPYCDLLWVETQRPDLAEAKRFSDAVRAKYPKMLFAYNLSPSFNWGKCLSAEEIANFQTELSKLGYKYQFITLASFHATNYAMFDLASKFNKTGMTAYAELQNKEFALNKLNPAFSLIRHQQEVGTGIFDLVLETLSSGNSSLLAMTKSTETEQFHDH